MMMITDKKLKYDVHYDLFELNLMEYKSVCVWLKEMFPHFFPLNETEHE
jgi:hypothetical protein